MSDKVVTMENTAGGKNFRELESLIDLLEYNTRVWGDKTVYTFLEDGEKEVASITYREFEVAVKSIGTFLLENGYAGERALMIYPPGIEFMKAFFGCLYAGAIAMPAYPPRSNKKLPRIKGILENSKPKLLLGTADILDEMSRRLENLPELSYLQWISTDEIDPLEPQEWVPAKIKADDLAFLQYTSGSTGNPKGVMVSHGNLVYNHEMMRVGFQYSENTRFVSWLPVFHDMGLIGNMLQPFYMGASCVFMSPDAFLQKPFRWLKAITDYKGTATGAPNFAYHLCVEKISEAQKKELDFTALEIAYCGSEPVRPKTLNAFYQAFKTSQFRREIFYPCFGLAEATLYVSGGDKTTVAREMDIDPEKLENGIVEQVSRGGKRVISCGTTYLEQEIRIIQPETLRECAENEVGEIWIRGRNCAQGYWENPEATREIFQATVAGEAGDKFYLRTGDMGFLVDGELHISGRMKDLIIIRGRNYYPEDIEEVVEYAHPALNFCRGAVFPMEAEGGEKLIIVTEVNREHARTLDRDEVTQSICAAVSEEFSLQVHDVVLIKPYSLTRTTSGKVQRKKTKLQYKEDLLKRL